ncbi:RNA polymerase sigma-70 factor (ECF subfamily) [Geodermatophilus tzadiensis]|uniref:RNA polymerase sigma factor n=1 Tax=Geodermatophilus tzadiensis TaxID=1137988 RepID=A0A2T0TZR0_9ACTN|nr:sigma-70 family RNA polymerase sigma factor [Geodermatophilus tzadiensis]PRY51160.1 RNA polymerase sigma-70 factor (ECF subfamily) [Geodermatophilus tzadiensis]
MDELERAAAAAVDGDPLAAATLVRATQSDVWRLCAALGDRQSADDLTQETYARAFASLHRFAGRSSLRTWLLSIARRVCADAVRSRRRRRLTLVRDDADLEALGRADGADRVGEGAAVTDLLARLDPERREAFALTQLLGLSYAEAAEVAGCPVGTIRSRVARARADLVEALGAAAGATGTGARTGNRELNHR